MSCWWRRSASRRRNSGSHRRASSSSVRPTSGSPHRRLRHSGTRLTTGDLLTTDNQIDLATGTARLKAVFPNQDGALFPNQFVNASLLVDTLKAAVLIPAAGIQRSPQSTYVWFVKPDSTVEMRDVEVGLTEGDTAQIRIQGLSDYLKSIQTK